MINEFKRGKAPLSHDEGRVTEGVISCYRLISPGALLNKGRRKKWSGTESGGRGKVAGTRKWIGTEMFDIINFF